LITATFACVGPLGADLLTKRATFALFATQPASPSGSTKPPSARPFAYLAVKSTVMLAGSVPGPLVTARSFDSKRIFALPAAASLSVTVSLVAVTPTSAASATEVSSRETIPAQIDARKSRTRIRLAPHQITRGRADGAGKVPSRAIAAQAIRPMQVHWPAPCGVGSAMTCRGPRSRRDAFRAAI